jgi:hypothetical protein
MTFEEAMAAIAKSLRDFGYPDADTEMITEVYDAFAAGKRGEKLPHGVVGRFAESQFEQVKDALASLAEARIKKPAKPKPKSKKRSAK